MAMTLRYTHLSPAHQLDAVWLFRHVVMGPALQPGQHDTRESEDVAGRIVVRISGVVTLTRPGGRSHS